MCHSVEGTDQNAHPSGWWVHVALSGWLWVDTVTEGPIGHSLESSRFRSGPRKGPWFPLTRWDTLPGAVPRNSQIQMIVKIITLMHHDFLFMSLLSSPWVKLVTKPLLMRCSLFSAIFWFWIEPRSGLNRVSKETQTKYKMMQTKNHNNNKLIQKFPSLPQDLALRLILFFGGGCIQILGANQVQLATLEWALGQCQHPESGAGSVSQLGWENQG